MQTRFPSPIKLTDENRAALTDALFASLCNGIDFYNLAKVAHWHTKGSLFAGLHELFGEVADAVADINDAIAEQAITLGALTPATTRTVAAKTAIPEIPTEETRDLALVRVVSARLQIYLDGLVSAYAVADKIREPSTIDLLGETTRTVGKLGWKLLAHLERGGAATSAA